MHCTIADAAYAQLFSLAYVLLLLPLLLFIISSHPSSISRLFFFTIPFSRSEFGAICVIINFAMILAFLLFIFPFGYCFFFISAAASVA